MCPEYKYEQILTRSMRVSTLGSFFEHRIPFHLNQIISYVLSKEIWAFSYRPFGIFCISGHVSTASGTYANEISEVSKYCREIHASNPRFIAPPPPPGPAVVLVVRTNSCCSLHEPLLITSCFHGYGCRGYRRIGGLFRVVVTASYQL
jgi:hypothetical protein